MPEGRATIDTASPPGSWRAALNPDAWCRACGQSLCDHPDPIYAGIVPPLNGARRDDPGASGASLSFHLAGDTDG